MWYNWGGNERFRKDAGGDLRRAPGADFLDGGDDFSGGGVFDLWTFDAETVGGAGEDWVW